MPIDANTDKQAPLRAGYNSLVPNPDKWQQFDRDLKLAQQLQQQIGFKPGGISANLRRQWHALLDKLQSKPA